MAKIDVLATILKVPEALLREAMEEVAKDVVKSVQDQEKDDGR